MAKQNKQLGFSVVEVLIIVAVVAALGFIGWFVYQRKETKIYSAQSTVSSKASEQLISSSELIAVAKQTYIQQQDAADNLPVVAVCGTDNTGACPFTDALKSKINTEVSKLGASSSFVSVLIAGIQNGPFGTLTYDPAVNGQIGTVFVNLTPSPSFGGAKMTWKLNLKKDNGKLLVDNIQYSSARADRAACGLVDIYDYSSCGRYLVIKEWGVKIKMKEASKVTYLFSSEQKGEESMYGDGIVDSTVKFKVKPEYLQDKTCDVSVFYIRYSSMDEQSKQYATQIGNYYYRPGGSPYNCENDPDNALNKSIRADYSDIEAL